jgi:head-tail adaptor
MPIAAGDLDRRIRIERLTLGARDEFNAFEPEEWFILAERRASRQDLSDRERVASQEAGSEISTRFQIRWSRAVADINPKDRVVTLPDLRIFGIVGVKEVGFREGLEISAVARSD